MLVESILLIKSILRLTAQAATGKKRNAKISLAYNTALINAEQIAISLLH
jgi:hypothetical protein